MGLALSCCKRTFLVSYPRRSRLIASLSSSSSVIYPLYPKILWAFSSGELHALRFDWDKVMGSLPLASLAFALLLVVMKPRLILLYGRENHARFSTI